MGMKESSTYQAILQEGREEGLRTGIQTGIQTGMIAAEQRSLLDIIRERFGSVPEMVEARIRATDDSAKLQAAIRQSVRVADPNDILR